MPARRRDAPLPLLRTRGRFAFVDDDALQSHPAEEARRAGLPAIVARTPGDVARLASTLERTRRLLRDEQAALLAVAAAQWPGGGHEAPGPAAVQALRYFARGDRLEVVIGLYVGATMPGGVGLCARHAMPGLQRRLLMRRADLRQAWRAFSIGAIDSCLERRVVAAPGALARDMKALAADSGSRRGELLGAAVSNELLEALATPAIAEHVEHLLERYGVVEHMVLGAPQGILGVTAAARPIWFQLETASSLAGLLEILREYGWSDEVLARVAAGESIVSEEFMGQLGKRATEQDMRLLWRDPLLGVGVFPIGELPPDLAPVTEPAAAA